ncbi:hypothetical protein [Plantactinospora sp. KLBMP9567]|uniref:hypothetical protein n=1 Tax=Plantactinospora sp. KLBMP9567 TaxID=3085900 RepID=UPI00298216E8|nr:hypothetical protein [Plantactinospora sp. KLBMP9567]MDW5329060.1 hypothetical protein [Plantactinospora sp. KLBMP9567]
MANIGHFSGVEVDHFRAVLWRLQSIGGDVEYRMGRHVAITAALPSWYIDFTGERPQIDQRPQSAERSTVVELQLPVISGSVDVRLERARPSQILGTGLILLTYPVLLFLSAFKAVAQFVRRAWRFLVRALDLQLPRPAAVQISRDQSVERVHQSVDRVGQLLGETLTSIDRHARARAPQTAPPRQRRAS